jgi:hypothetical protein
MPGEAERSLKERLVARRRVDADEEEGGDEE